MRFFRLRIGHWTFGTSNLPRRWGYSPTTSGCAGLWVSCEGHFWPTCNGRLLPVAKGILHPGPYAASALNGHACGVRRESADGCGSWARVDANVGASCQARRVHRAHVGGVRRVHARAHDP